MILRIVFLNSTDWAGEQLFGWRVVFQQSQSFKDQLYMRKTCLIPFYATNYHFAIRVLVLPVNVSATTVTCNFQFM